MDDIAVLQFQQEYLEQPQSGDDEESADVDEWRFVESTEFPPFNITLNSTEKHLLNVSKAVIPVLCGNIRRVLNRACNDEIALSDVLNMCLGYVMGRLPGDVFKD